MSSLAIASITFAVIFAAALLAVFLRSKLPEPHVSDSSKEIVRLVMGLIATMAALVLGLLIASAKNSYDTQSGEVLTLSTQVVQLDRMLAAYGPEAQDARAQFHAAVEQGIQRIWPTGEGRTANLALSGSSRAPIDVYAAIARLDPKTNGQRFAQSRALEIAVDLSRTRVMMAEQAGSAISLPFLVVLVFWLVILFMGFGLFAPANATVIASLLVGALSVAGALFLILELDRPYEGMMHLSSAPLVAAAAQIGR